MRRYYNVEPKIARVLEPGDRYPVEKVVATVVKTSEGVLLTFDDGSSMRLAYDDALLVVTPPLPDTPAGESQDAAAAAQDVLASSEPVGDEIDGSNAGETQADGSPGNSEDSASRTS